MKKSIKKQFAGIFIGLMAGTIMLCWLLNTVFLQSYYINDRVTLLIRSYNDLKEVYLDEEYSIDKAVEKIVQINTVHNINTCFIDSNWNIVYSSQNNADEMIVRYKENLFNKETNILIIEENSEYSIVRSENTIRGFSYLEIYGTLDNGSQILMQVTLDSIQENVRIFNRFVHTFRSFQPICTVRLIAGIRTSP